MLFAIGTVSKDDSHEMPYEVKRLKSSFSDLDEREISKSCSAAELENIFDNFPTPPSIKLALVYNLNLVVLVKLNGSETASRLNIRSD